MTYSEQVQAVLDAYFDQQLEPLPRGVAEHIVDAVRAADKYNGWRNYETWNVHLWLTNDEETYSTVRAIVAGEDADEDPYPNVKVRDYVEEYVFGWGDDAPANLGTDLLSNALDSVDWDAVVEAFREEA